MAEQQSKGLGGVRSQVGGIWAQMSPAQRMFAGLAVAAVVGGLAWILLSGNKAEMVPLARGMNPQDEATAVAALEEAKIPYELDGGGTILVPKEHIHDARLELAVSTMPGGKTVGFEIFDETELGRSAFNEKVNYHRALEGELSRTIRHLQPVEQARVHLVMPERRLFENDQAEPSASVVLQLRPGQTLSPRQVLAIRHLVGSAVERLAPDRVAIVDQSGGMLARPQGEEDVADTLFEKQMGFERGLERRISELLEPLVGVGNVKAQVSARLDFSRVVETTEKFDPDGAVVRSERLREEKSQTGETVANGAPGTTSNVPGGAGTAQALQNGTGSERSDRVVNYEIDRKTEKRETPHARVDRLSVAVVVNGVEKASDAGGEPLYTPRTTDDMARYQAIVQNAVGFDLTRGDQVSVTNVRFVRGADLEVAGSATPEGVLANPAVRWALIALGVLAVLVLVMLVMRARKTAARAAQVRLAETQRIAELAAKQAEALEGTGSRLLDAKEMGEPTISDRVQLLRQKAIEQGRADVRRTASVLRGWLGQQEISG